MTRSTLSCSSGGRSSQRRIWSAAMKLANVTGRQVQTQAAVKALQVGLKVWETADTQTFVSLMTKTSEMLNMVQDSATTSFMSTLSIKSDVNFFQFSRGKPSQFTITTVIFCQDWRRAAQFRWQCVVQQFAQANFFSDLGLTKTFLVIWASLKLLNH